MEVIVRGHHLTVPARFREHAATKLGKLAKLDARAMRIDVEVSKERNSKQPDRRERVELTIRSRGPAIRAEAAAEDRYTALDMALAKLESRLRRASDRRKVKHGDSATVRGHVLAGAAEAPVDDLEADQEQALKNGDGDVEIRHLETGTEPQTPESFGRKIVPIQMEGEGPLLVREKEHPAKPMPIDQALLEMELVGHDFFLFHDSDCDKFSVVYRRRGYDYGVIRLIEE